MTRLTEEMVIARSKQSDLSSIKKLNCWGSDLSDVSIIKRMRGVEVLALSVNKICTLQPFEDCTKLQELYLRKNNIQDINEIAYLQNLPALKYLWLEENPCCDRAGPNYRSIVLHALPNLKKLDNIEVTQEEIDDAMRLAEGRTRSTSRSNAEEILDDYEPHNSPTSHSHPHQQQHHQQHHPQQHQQQHQHHQQQQQHRQQHQNNNNSNNNNNHHHHPQQQSMTRRSSSPLKEILHQASTESNEDKAIPAINQSSIPPSPTKDQPSPSSPKYTVDPKENRHFSNQIDRSSGSDQESSPQSGYRERAPIPPSISTHSMKEYCQSDRPAYPSGHYRHSQTDLTEWEEHQQHNQYASNLTLYHSSRRSAGNERSEHPERYSIRNGYGRENGGEWDDFERSKPRRLEGRFSDSTSNVLSHYSGHHHRRPINRVSKESSNLLSATLCLVKELDYPSLEVVEHAVRCRIDELSAD